MTKPERHHILFPANFWKSSVELSGLRSVQWLVPPLSPETHSLLHANVALVPAPERHMAKRIAKEFYPVKNDYMASLDNLILATQEARDYHSAQYLERQIGNLMIEALEMQQLFIGMDYEQ